MNGQEEIKTEFDQAFREWTARPIPTPPSRAAAEVMAQLESSRAERSPWVLATALAIAGLSIVLLLLPGTRPAQLSKPTQNEVTLASDHLLLWLDSETPLYLTLDRGVE